MNENRLKRILRVSGFWFQMKSICSWNEIGSMDNEKIDLASDRIDAEWLVDKLEEFCSFGVFCTLDLNWRRDNFMSWWRLSPFRNFHLEAAVTSSMSSNWFYKCINTRTVLNKKDFLKRLSLEFISRQAIELLLKIFSFIWSWSWSLNLLAIA